MTYILAQDCIPVKGFLRSCIYDLGRQRYFFIPNELLEILSNDSRLNQLLKDTENEYSQFLLAREFVIGIPESQKKHFSKLSHKWNYPFKIMRCFFLIENHHSSIGDLLQKANELNVFEVNITVQTKQIQEIENALKGFTFPNVNLFINVDCSNDTIARLATQHPNYSIFLISPNDARNLTDYQNIRHLIELPFVLSPSPEKMHVTISAFMESQKHNLFFNRSVFVKDDGYIYDYSWSEQYQPFLSYNFEGIDRDTFFSNTWNVRKDDCDVCKVCEMRYMCNDPRIPIRREESNEYYHDRECDYNPFISKWKGEQGYLSLKDIGVDSDNKQYKCNQRKINLAISNIWG